MNVLTWLDDVLELAPIADKFLRDGFTLGLFISVAVFLIRRYRKRNPSQLERIERKVELLGEERGISWAAHGLKSCSKDSVRKSKLPSISRLGEFINVLIVRRNIKSRTIERRMNMANKFKSRKFWMAVVTAILIVLNDGLDLGIDSETVLTFAGLVATWILGESVIDAKRTGNGGQMNAEHHIDDGPAV